MLNGNKYPQMSKSNMARKTIIMFCIVLKCLIRHIVHMIRALPVDPNINKMKENVRQMIRFSMLYSSIVRITPKYIFRASYFQSMYFRLLYSKVCISAYFTPKYVFSVTSLVQSFTPHVFICGNANIKITHVCWIKIFNLLVCWSK